ncbi:hypothetical protein LguiA_034708 [Lonicera macranthoides]
MAKAGVVFGLLIILGLALIRCRATTYTVGDSSGWDISTDLDTWTQDKRFVVGDVLLFLYSSTHSVCEVTPQNYQGCNTTNVLQTSSNGNTTFSLTKPGDRYFVCGNRLHCLGGMKLHVHVQKVAAAAPASAPDSGASLPTPSSKNNNPASVIPSSASFVHVGLEYVFFALLGFMAVLPNWVV